jgi:hypothetical protein
MMEYPQANCTALSNGYNSVWIQTTFIGLRKVRVCDGSMLTTKQKERIRSKSEGTQIYGLKQAGFKRIGRCKSTISRENYEQYTVTECLLCGTLPASICSPFFASFLKTYMQAVVHY